MKTETKNKNKSIKLQHEGISLIVLVITVVVMIILATAVILSLNDNNIIENANKAAESTNENNVQIMAKNFWLEAYKNGTRSEEELKTLVVSNLQENNINTDEYYINVTTAGVYVKLLKNVWVQNGLTLVKGDQVIEIGDKINYDETVGGTKTGLTDTQWHVMGATDTGDLLILSSVNIGNVTFGENVGSAEANLLEAQKDWLTATQQLDSVCEPYGYGKDAKAVARCITAEEVNKIVGYEPTNFFKGKIEEYGNEVTLYYNGTTSPRLESTNGKNGTLQNHNNGLIYYNGKKFVVEDLTKASGIITKIKNNHYYYDVKTSCSISKDSKAYKMLFGENDQFPYYWVSADKMIFITSQYIGYKIHFTGLGGLYDYTAFTSKGEDIDACRRGVRAVVTLSKEIELKGNSTIGWSY